MTRLAPIVEPRVAFPKAKPSHTASRLDVSMHAASEGAHILQEWKRLDERLNRGAMLACSWIWTQTWLDHYGSLIPHHFAVARRDGVIRGLCLITEGVSQKQGPFSVRTRHLGTAGEPDEDSVRIQYNNILIDEQNRADFAHGLLSLLATDGQWDELRLDGFRSDDIDLFLSAKEAWSVRSVKSHFFNLKAARESCDDALSRLGYSTRKTIRWNLKAYKKLTGQWAESLDDAESIFADLVRLHQRRWQAAGQPGAYASQRFLQFHEDLLHRLFAAGRTALFRVCSGQDVVGCVQLFFDGNRALCYQGGSAPYADKRSPGLIVDYLCIEECLCRGFDAYDFLGGDSLHKERLSTDFNLLGWACFRRRRLKNVVVDVARRIKRSVTSTRRLPCP